MTTQPQQEIPKGRHTRYCTYGYYEKKQKERTESLLKDNFLVEGMDYFWAEDSWISVWELWALPDKHRKIYEIIHSTV
ncbi:MAG: hypothetical protein ACRC6M_08240 [Microcystaceae cyanobacterium]